MAIHFRDAALAPLQQVTVSAPDGALIGVIGEDSSGVHQLLRLAAGLEAPQSGSVEITPEARYLGRLDDLQFGSPATLAPATLAIDHSFAAVDALRRAQALLDLDRLRRAGASILLASHDLDLLEQTADEIWWIDAGQLKAKGDPREVAAEYRRHIAARLRAWGQSAQAPLPPSLRRGDGRADILSIQTLDAHSHPSLVIQSGEPMSVRVTVKFQSEVPDPVVGIMIRTRIGSEVYGTNTELERLPLGPVAAGETLAVDFRFPCQLCPQEYTVTAASHDPNGVWHDWMEDALAFAVADNRYTAGVANLRATVTARRNSIS
jgi:lipopolysaccharide transport system ATP-binding protein